jgi:hypothetical protein
VSEPHLEKKSLGKGLEEVSNIFLSNDDKERQMDTISLSDAENGKNFEPNPSMNTGGKENETLNSAHPDPDDDDCGVEESVSVYRRIAYPNTENAQKGMRKALFKYFEDGFHIRSISLRKTTGGKAPSRTEKREEITLLVKGS